MSQCFLSNISKIFIKRITEHFKEGIQQFHSDGKIQISEIYTSETSPLKKGLKYTYINEEIRKSIESSNWIGETISFKIHSKKITVHLVYPCKSISRELSKIKKFFHNIRLQIFSWLYVASFESEKECSKDLTIYIYFTDFKKALPQVKKTPLGEINVNTGFTFSCNLSAGENEMYIYRKEEWFKVLIHESFHSFSLDYLGLSNELIERIDRKVIQIFPLHIDLRFYETYCEMWAELLQIIYINIDSILQGSWSKLERMIRKDQTHSLQQAVKVLKHHHMEYMDLFEKTDRAQQKRIEYRENSPVISYYLLKSIFYMNISRYIEWTSINNKGTLRFLKTEHSVNSYVGLLRECYKSPKYIEMVKKYEKTVGDNHLRMSYWDA
jgi:hypothetical protein